LKGRKMANETILIIEDEEYLAQSIRDLLEPSGYQMHIALDREEGREKIDRLKPDQDHRHDRAGQGG
jgi:DNA-binding response OmpR family regulator